MFAGLAIASPVNVQQAKRGEDGEVEPEPMSLFVSSVGDSRFDHAPVKLRDGNQLTLSDGLNTIVYAKPDSSVEIVTYPVSDLMLRYLPSEDGPLKTDLEPHTGWQLDADPELADAYLRLGDSKIFVCDDGASQDLYIGDSAECSGDLVEVELIRSYLLK